MAEGGATGISVNAVRRLALTAIGAAKAEPPGPLLSEEEVHPAVKGVISLHIKECKKLYTGDLSTYTNCFMRISVRNLTKRTRVAQVSYGTVMWDQIKHFPVTVLRNRRHPFNLLTLQLFAFESQNAMSHKPVGSVSLHLHDIVKASPVSGEFDLWDRHHIVGELHLDIAFTYGFFGYGYSVQLKDELQPEQHVAHSLFPRVDPPEDRREPQRLTMTPKAVRHPAFIPFAQRVVLGYGASLAAILNREEDDEKEREDFALLRASMGRLESLRAQYTALSSRHERLAFLRRVILASNARLEAVKEDTDFDGTEHAPKPYFRYMRPTISLTGLTYAGPNVTGPTYAQPTWAGGDEPGG
eukprot:tig00000144_g9044.t1